jgi:hypothetical protein
MFLKLVPFINRLSLNAVGVNAFRHLHKDISLDNPNTAFAKDNSILSDIQVIF